MLKRLKVHLTPFEWALWMTSILVVAGTAWLFGGADWVSVAASLIGVTALIFVAKGHILGQMLTILFAVFYGVISWAFRYYGEMITYLCMTAPMAMVALVTWLKHPYQDSEEVAVNRLTRRQVVLMLTTCALVTAAFYFILRAMGNAALAVSTLSITTSYLASYLTACRSPWYALAYAANDVVLMILWLLAALTSPTGAPMVACFTMFLLNDLYGFVNWRRMQRRQMTNG